MIKLRRRLIVVIAWLLTTMILVQVFIATMRLQDGAINDYHPNYTDLQVLKKIPTEKDVLWDVDRLRTFIFTTNLQQPILNSPLYPTNSMDLVIVVQVHNRPHYLKHLITSMSSAPEINRSLLVFSHDVYNATTNSLVRAINFTKVLQIFYPLSAQAYPKGFPGPDPDRPRNASISQMKHHWWWKANFIFNRVRVLQEYNGMVLFLEEDHYVTRDFIHCIHLMRQEATKMCPNCWFFSLAFWKYQKKKIQARFDLALMQTSVESFGLAFNRSVWYAIARHSDIFCKYDDYNWDWSLRHIIYDVFRPTPLSMIMARPRVEHIGVCGIHTRSKLCDPQAVIDNFHKKHDNLFPTKLIVLSLKNKYVLNRNGGWGDPRDRALCLGMT